MSDSSHSESNVDGPSVLPIPLTLSAAVEAVSLTVVTQSPNYTNPKNMQKQDQERSTSRIDVGHFDPVGVDELQRTMSHNLFPTLEDAGEFTRRASISSDVTLTAGDGPIDFEKTLRTVMKK
jgi:ATP-binding cassette subfamily G (WHITE) protein 2 (SNQ2)